MTTTTLLEGEIMLPESFVVLQGIQGDGMQNTMDSVPIVFQEEATTMTTDDADEEESEGFHHVEVNDDYHDPGDDDEQSSLLLEAAASSSSGEQQQRRQVRKTPITQSPLATFDPMLATTNMPPLALNPLTTTTTTAATTTTTSTTATSFRRTNNATSSDHDSFIVVSDHHQQQHHQRRQEHHGEGTNIATTRTTATTTSRAEERAMEVWNADCRSRELRQRHDWIASQKPGITTGSSGSRDTRLPFSTTTNATPRRDDDNDDWWQTTGRLIVFKDIATIALQRTKKSEITTATGINNRTRTLSPGATVVGTEIVYLDCESLQPIPSRRMNVNNNSEHPMGVAGQVQMLKLESPREGYVALSVNGYCYLAPGLPAQYVDPHVWVWRITYAAGAWVREGLELNSRHICTLPYGSFVKVMKKTVNDSGIPRLWVHAILRHDEGATPVEGWISEYLNSASGERGPIAHPLPFPLPALYRVTLPAGALIRSDVELSSKQIGHAPFGAVLSIVVRAFSEHPQDKCIERLKLAGNGGWVSLRLNEEPPDDVLVFEFENTDGRFDPDRPGIFHLEAQAGVIHQVNPEYEGADLSSIDESNASIGSSSVSVVRSGVATDGPLRHGYSRDHCIMCLSEERNATIVHGETGHIACCLVCARILKGQGQDCPVCRLPIDSVIQHFWA